MNHNISALNLREPLNLDRLDWRLTCGRWEFERNGCKYVTGREPLASHHTPASWLNEVDYRYSPDGVYCDRVGALKGTRIGLFDISRHQARPLSRLAIEGTFEATPEDALSFGLGDGETRYRRMLAQGVNQHYEHAQFRIIRTPTQIRRHN